MEKKLDYPIHPFPIPEKWESWLKKNHQKEPGLWLRIFKKDSKKPTVTYDQALEVALCYGWIDGQKNSYDAESWLQKFTPRRAKSVWSKRNTLIVERLIQEGKMQPAGLLQIEVAKKDGRWQKAYAGQKDMVLPEDFLALLKKNKKALTFFETLNASNRYAIAYRIHAAKKPETRERKIKEFLEMLSKGAVIHPVMKKKKI